jgi:hypothetical protein
MSAVELRGDEGFEVRGVAQGQSQTDSARRIIDGR